MFYQVDGFFAIDYLEMDPENEDSYFEILEEFLKADSPFPKNFRVKVIPEKFVELKSFIKSTKDMHNAVNNRDFHAVKNILSANKQQNYFYPYKKSPFKNISAWQLAKKENFNKAFKVFYEKNVLPAPFESNPEAYNTKNKKESYDEKSQNQNKINEIEMMAVPKNGQKLTTNTSNDRRFDDYDLTQDVAERQTFLPSSN